MPDLSVLYKHRFEEARRDEKIQMWGAICKGYFQKLIGKNETILDLASGYGEFSNNIIAANKLAVDLNPDAKQYLPSDVKFYETSALNLTSVIEENSVDTVFTSNFLEHLFSKKECDEVLSQVFKILKPGGQFIIMGPNIKYLPGAYWDFYDHYLPLTHISMEEGIIQAGFEPKKTIAKFLPYTTKSALPTHPLLISLYLKLPIFWPLLGKQFLVIGTKK